MGRGDEILRLVELNKTFVDKEGHKIVALNNITTTFKRGEFVAVVGRSGSGKSTLINILGGLDIPTAGNYFCEGNDVTRLNENHWDALRNNKIGFIFQEYHLLDYLTVYENVEISLKYQDIDDASKDAKILEILKNVGLLEHKDKKTSDLSGGQRQRVAVARALVKDPDIILADEPTGALDVNTADEIISLLKGLSNDRLVIVVTHDRRIANLHANRIIEIGQGRFLTDLVKEEIEQTYQNTYRKTQATNLSLDDKIKITKRKIASRVFRTIFTSITLALAFGFTIVFNGIERGFTESYDEYYNILNKTNSFSFDLRSDIGDGYSDVSLNQYNNAINNIVTTYNGIADIESANSRNVITDGSTVYDLISSTNNQDLLDEFKLRIYNDELKGKGLYNFDSIMIGESNFPTNTNEIMVSTKLIRDYFNVGENIDDLSAYVGKSIQMDNYTNSSEDYLYGSNEYLAHLYHNGTDFVFVTGTSNNTPVSYNEINIPMYCYTNSSKYNIANVADEDAYFANKCNSYFKVENRVYFDNYDDYITYVDEYKAQVIAAGDNTPGGLTGNALWQAVINTDLVYYMGSLAEIQSTSLDSSTKYVEEVFSAFDNDPGDGTNYLNVQTKDLKTPDATSTTFVVSAIIENNYESQVYVSDVDYNNMFKFNGGKSAVSSYFSVMMNHEIEQVQLSDVAYNYFVLPLNSVDNNVVSTSTFRVYTADKTEVANTCSTYPIDTTNPASDLQVDLAGSNYHITDYSSCKFESEAYHSIASISLLFGVFFNVLMIVSIIFFNLLLKVILQERISEIGVYRSVGATSKDVKTLFFVEIFIMIILAIVFSLAIIFTSNYFVNQAFLNLVDANSRVISFAGVNLSLGSNNQLTSISIFNLIFYIVVTLGVILFLSNRSVSKLSDTKPIDILRDVE